MTTKKTVKKETVVTDVVAKKDEELTLAEKFLMKEIEAANQAGLTRKRKVHLELVRRDVAATRKGEHK